MQKHNNVKSKLHKIQKIKYSVPRYSAKLKRLGRQNNLKCIYKLQENLLQLKASNIQNQT